MHVQTQVHEHSTLMRAHTHITHTYARTYTTHSHTLTFTLNAYITHTCAKARARTYTHTHARTHTHMQTRPNATHTGTAPGQDLNLSLERITANRNFTNKLWNAGKFILFQMDRIRAAGVHHMAPALVNSWLQVHTVPPRGPREEGCGLQGVLYTTGAGLAALWPELQRQEEWRRR